MRDARTLRSSASSRSAAPRPRPHESDRGTEQPTHGRCAIGPKRRRAPRAPRRQAARHAGGGTHPVGAASPATGADATSAVGQPDSTAHAAITASPGRAAARRAPARCPGSHRDRRPIGTARGSGASRRSSAPSRADPGQLVELLERGGREAHLRCRRAPCLAAAAPPQQALGQARSPAAVGERRGEIDERDDRPGAVTPPAGAIASATRAPSASRYRPGVRTAPTTCTTERGAGGTTGELRRSADEGRRVGGAGRRRRSPPAACPPSASTTSSATTQECDRDARVRGITHGSVVGSTVRRACADSCAECVPSSTADRGGPRRSAARRRG